MFDPAVKIKKGNHRSGFTIVETLVAVLILSLVMAGLIYGYVQANRIAAWSSMSLAAQAYAVQGAERARVAQWNSQMWPLTNGPGTGDELPPTTNSSPVFVEVDTNYIPSTRLPVLVTNFIYLTTAASNPPLRQIRSDVVWTFPVTGALFTNTVVTLRAPDL